MCARGLVWDRSGICVGAAHWAARLNCVPFLGGPASVRPLRKDKTLLHMPQGRVPSPARKPSPLGGRWLAEGQTDEGAGLRLLFCRGGTLYRLGTAR